MAVANQPGEGALDQRTIVPVYGLELRGLGLPSGRRQQAVMRVDLQAPAARNLLSKSAPNRRSM